MSPSLDDSLSGGFVLASPCGGCSLTLTHPPETCAQHTATLPRPSRLCRDRLDRKPAATPSQQGSGRQESHQLQPLRPFPLIDFPSRRFRRGQRLLDTGRLDGGLFDRELARLHAGDVEEILDEAVHTCGGALNHLDGLARPALWILSVPPKSPTCTAMFPRGIPEVVGDDAEHVVESWTALLAAR
jgi:hypothetical protein